MLFANAINAGDIEAVIKLYEPGACLIPEPGEVASGTGAIRLALGGFLAMVRVALFTASVPLLTGGVAAAQSPCSGRS